MMSCRNTMIRIVLESHNVRFICHLLHSIQNKKSRKMMVQLLKINFLQRQIRHQVRQHLLQLRNQKVQQKPQIQLQKKILPKKLKQKRQQQNLQMQKKMLDKRHQLQLLLQNQQLNQLRIQLLLQHLGHPRQNHRQLLQ